MRPARHARVRAAAAALALLLTLGGCINSEEEQVLGAQIAQQVNQQAPLVRDPVLTQYVSIIGNRLAAQSARAGLPFHFYIVNSPIENAFALPGGYIYVTTGLIEQTRNASELAAVLAHEIGHVAARHGAQKLERQLRTGSAVGILYRLMFGGEPKLINENALRLGTVLWNARHSRADEAEADRLAVGYLVKAGFSPEGMVTLLERLMAQDGAREAKLGWFATHPTTQQRIRTLQAQIATLPPADTASPALRNLASYPAFLLRIEALPTVTPSN
jgi:predicted Zn-dependent protease